MRDRVVWLTTALVLGVIASGPSQAQQITNLFQNPGFETGALTPWGSYGSAAATVTSTVVKDCVGADVPEGPIEGTYCLNVKVSGPGVNYWDGAVSPVLIAGQGVFKQGKKYTLSLFFKSKSGTATINLKPQLAQDPWTGYGSAQVTATDKWAEYHITTPVMTADVTPASITFHVLFAAQEFWIDDVKWYEGDYVPTVVKNKFGAASPTPDDKGVDVPQDATLSWKAGPFANTHNVYFGASFDDVNNASLTQAVSQGQSGTTYEPATLLDFGTTYYWRVDEVNTPPSTAIFKGNVWSFTTEPYAYPITGITATASSSDKTTTGPANTINGSGLTGDLHSTASDAMWASSMTGTQPTWIQYNFGKVYRLFEMWVWNHNTEFEPVLGYGFKDVTIEYSLDGTNWTLLTETQFAQAQAAAGYAHNTTVDFGGVMAQYVRLTANSNWSMVGIKQYGLSEVRFYNVPVQARAPQPAIATSAVSVDRTLDWRPGRDVSSEQVYLGTDKAAVANGTAPAQTVTGHGFDPGPLDFGTTYYWKVDEIGAESYPGEVWKFTTQEYMVVDDFESYSDKEDALIFDTWTDGYIDQSSGSMVGKEQSANGTFGETTIIHGGKQSMPLTYDNSRTPYYSEATRTFDEPQNWTVNGAQNLTLYFQGYPAPASVSITESGGKISLTGAGADIWGNNDEFTYAYKTLSGDGSIVARVVDKGTGSNTWAKGGVMIRDSLAGGSTHAMMVLTANSDGTAGNGCSFQWRPVADNATSNADGAAPAVTVPYWVKMQRTGDTLSGFVSPDGKTWKQIGITQLITMDAPVYIGLCVTSHAAGEQRTFQFDSISTTGGVSGSWQGAVIASPRNNDAAPLYVTLEDKAGKKKTVVNPDPAATTAATWKEWKIALSDFTGVNTAAVKKMTIGVGDRANPKPGGTGLLYIDDILFGKPIQPVGLVAHYTLENDVNDLSGNGHHGTLIGAPTFVAGAPGLGTGLLFPGTPGNGVDLGTFNPSEKTGMLSVSLWAKWNGLSGQWQGLIGKRNSWADGQTMWQIEANQTTGALSFQRYNIGATTGNPVLKVGEWTHIAATFDRTTARFYVNGTQTGSGPFSFGPNEEAALEFGCDNSGGGNPFNGALDDIRLYDVVLTSAEVLALAGK